MIKIKTCYKISISTLICLCFLVSISGCASDQVITNKTDYEQLLLQEINASSQNISHSLCELNALANPYNAKIELPFTEVKDSALQKRAKLSWYGDIEPLLRQAASMIGYQFQVYGQKPALPVLIQMGSPEYPIIGSILYILQNIQIQARSEAYIYIDSERKLLSVRYTA